MADIIATPNDTVARFRAGDVLNAVKDVVEVPDDDQLDVADLVRMFEESEEATMTARQESERDRDYVDNKQLTSEELSALTKRGQPPQIDNRIKTKVDYLVGLEKQQRINPRALPRTPMHEDDAQGASEALRYVADTESFDNKRSGVWRNMLVEGAGGISVSVEPSRYSTPQSPQQMMASTAMTPPMEYDIKIRRIPWDRMFWDPHSSETDFSDAGYLGAVIWKDYDDAVNEYTDPVAREALETTLSTAPSETYDDKPKFTHWADKKRKRIRVCQIWVMRDEQWHFAEFTKGGILKAGPSPYKTDKGESDCELFFQSAYVDRDNNRYGLVREMITLQDGINKRHSKALHLLNTAQIVMELGAVDDIEKTRKEASRPDGVIVVAPGHSDKFRFETRTDLAMPQLQLLQEAKNAIDLKGPNATQMGDKAQGSSSASGRAILASQQGGMVSLGDLLDNLRHLDIRVFRAIWARIRQFWTAEKWIRVTDDERNIKWVGINVDPQQVQMAAQQNPQIGGMIKGAVGNVAELDCDIVIDEAPDSVVPALEQFEALVNLKQYDANNELPFRAIVAAMPNLKDKHKLLEAMDQARQPNPKAEEAEQIQKAGAIAQVEETKSKTALNMARAQGEQMPEMGQPPQPQEFEIPPQIQVAKAVADVEYVHANTENKRVQTQLAPAKASHDARMSEQQLAQRRQQMQRQPARQSA